MEKTPLNERAEGWIAYAMSIGHPAKRVLLHKNDMIEAKKIYKGGTVLFLGKNYPIEYIGAKVIPSPLGKSGTPVEA